MKKTKMKKTMKCLIALKNDDVRLLLTTTSKKKAVKKMGRKSSWISFLKKKGINDVVYLSTFASYFDVNKRGVCQHHEDWHKVPMSCQTLGSFSHLTRNSILER
jgi:hypothetical protein